MAHSPAAEGGALAELRRGWSTLAGATLGLAIGASALPFYTGGLFIGAFERDFGWTRVAWSLVSTGCTVLLAICAPLVGMTVDRFGVRFPSMISFAALAAGYFAMSRIDGDFAKYTALQLVLVVLGAASTPIAFTRAVNAAFDRIRGLALGIAIGGIGATAFIAPKLLGPVIQSLGWRVAYERMALAVIVAAPIVFLLLTLGRRAPTPNADHLPSTQGWPLRDAQFWRLLAAFFLISLGVAGFVGHFVPMLTDHGLTLVRAAEIQATLGIAVLIGRVSVGALLDRIFAPFVAAGMLAVTAASLVALALAGPAWAAPAAFGVGFAIGAEVDLIAYLTARYFGMGGYARLYGALYGAFLIGTALSPLFIALVQARAQSYVPSLLLSASFLVVAAAIFLWSRRFPVG